MNARWGEKKAGNGGPGFIRKKRMDWLISCRTYHFSRPMSSLKNGQFWAMSIMSEYMTQILSPFTRIGHDRQNRFARSPDR
ncbi:MAG: hypothetical protein LBC67_00885, partial [Spirochaetales bacterium]|nr:hypothetical protein [Spirochaetales bacterium]